MTEWEKAQKGYLYDANYDKEIVEARTCCADLCYEFNNLRPSDTEKQQELLKKILGKMEGTPVITAPFYCDYGINISVGRNFYTNHNVTILDCAKVTFGDNVFIAPNCVFSTAGHAIDSEQRSRGLEIALPITVGDDVWILSLIHIYFMWNIWSVMQKNSCAWSITIEWTSDSFWWIRIRRQRFCRC